jgi:hypothetical protein
MRIAVNLLAFNAAWFACVLGGAWEVAWLAPLAAAGVVGVHLLVQPGWRAELALVASAMLFGFVLDSALVALGVFSPKRVVLPAPLTALWLVMLWGSFATILNVSIRRFQGHWVVAGLFGAVGGPVAYYSGARLGALEMGQPVWRSLILLGVGWAVAVPALLWLARALRLRLVAPEPSG